MTTNSLSERAMLASLKIRRWQASLTDKKITAEVATHHAVSAKRAGRYRKNAIDINAPSFRAVVEAASELRNKHYFYTLPWGQDGAQILTTAIFEEYSKEMRQLRLVFEQRVTEFVAEYPELKRAARLELNGMYNEADYPADIAAKFGVEILFMPLPASEDFRAALSDSTVAEIKQGIHREVEKTVQAAVRAPYERLYGRICHMVERLSDPKAVFRDTLITGLAELCAILPGLNLTQDPQLDALRRRTEKMIADLDPQDLREVPAVRSAVAQQASEIQQLMAGFMGATPTEEVP
jgi:hypothetical protein